MNSYAFFPAGDRDLAVDAAVWVPERPVAGALGVAEPQPITVANAIVHSDPHPLVSLR